MPVKKVLLAVTVLGIVMSAVFQCGRKLDDSTIAVVDNQNIPVDVFLWEYPKDQFDEYSDEKKREIIDDFIEREVVYYHALQKGYDENNSVGARLKQQRDRIITNGVIRHFVIDKVITEDLIREFYDKMDREVRASHILISFRGASGARADRTERDAELLTQKIYTEIENGADFGQLAIKYSDDPSVKNNRGDLGFFPWGRMAPEFQAAAFSLNKGEYSGPVRTMFGYHIIHVEDIRQVPRGTYEEEKEKIRKLLERGRRNELQAEYNNLANSLKEKYTLTLSDETIKTLATEISSYYNKSARSPGSSRGRRNPVEALKNISVTGVLASTNRRQYDISWFTEQLETINSPRIPGMRNAGEISAAVEGLITQELLLNLAESSDIADSKEIKMDYRRFEKQILYHEYLQNEVNSRILVDEELLKDFYQKNKDAYTTEEMRAVYEVFTKDSSRADSLYAAIVNGASVEELAPKYTERVYAKERGGVLGPFTEKKFAELSRQAFLMKQDEVSRPIKWSAGYSIIKIKDIIPDGFKPFEDVRSRVKQDYIKDQKMVKKNDLVEKLKKEFNVRVNRSIVL